jgi:hypothetical protein
VNGDKNMALFYSQEKSYKDNNQRKNFIFMGYPHSPPLPLDDYRKVISELESVYPIRMWYFLDEITSNEMMRKIWRSILRSDLSIFDISDGNANVSFELGLSVAIEKKAFALFKTGSKNPLGDADLGYAERLEYTSSITLKSKIEETIKSKSLAMKLFKEMSYTYFDASLNKSHVEIESLIISIVNYVFQHKTINKHTAKDLIKASAGQTSNILKGLREQGILSIIGSKRYSKYEFTGDWVYKDHEVAGD